MLKGEMTKQLSDETVVVKTRWSLLKNFYMKENYKEMANYKKLDENKKKLVEALREKQHRADEAAGNEEGKYAKLEAGAEQASEQEQEEEAEEEEESEQASEQEEEAEEEEESEEEDGCCDNICESLTVGWSNCLGCFTCKNGEEDEDDEGGNDFKYPTQG